MPKKTKQPGAFTLFELMVTVAIIAMMVAILIPSARAMRKSYDSTGGLSMINAALSNARAIAAKEQRYAGVRFQQVYDANTEAPLIAPQYMIIVIEDSTATGLESGFRAYQGIKPIRFPNNIGVLDLKIRTDDVNETNLDNQSIKVGADIQENKQVTDTTTFSVIFSPSGKLIITDVRIRNKDGKAKNEDTNYKSDDEVFNTITKINETTAGQRFGMLAQDDYAEYGLGAEYSRNSFVIYDREKFKALWKFDPQRLWKEYLSGLKTYHISPYTGTIVEKE